MIKYDDTYWDDVESVVETIPHLTELFHRTVLITGGTGMICSAVAELLFHLNRTRAAGIGVILAGRSRERMERRFYPFSEGVDYTFLQYNATKNETITVHADYIIHGASNASPAAFRDQPVETMLSNLVGLNSLLETAAKTHVKRLLYISSSEVYGQRPGGHPYGEGDYGYVDILNTRAAYPSSKRAAETLCAAYGAEYGVDAVIVRPGHIYGPSITDSDDRASAQFTRSALRGENILMKSAGAQLRSYCHTLDCASAILTVLLKGENGQAYNISNRNSIVTIRDVAEALAKEAGVKVVFEASTERERKGYNMMDNSSLDAEKLERLGWHARFDLREGVAATVRSMELHAER